MRLRNKVKDTSTNNRVTSSFFNCYTNNVLNLGKDKSIKEHDLWPRPSITDVKRALGKLALDYCEDFNRVSLQKKIYLDYYLFLFNSLQLQLLQIRTSYKFNILLVYWMTCQMMN